MRYSEFRIRLIELSDAVRRQTAERWRKENPQLTDAQINYYLDNWDRYSQGFETQYKDITRLTFAQVEQLIDHAQARAELKGKAKPEQTFDQNDDMIYNRNNLVVLKGDLREKCIQYGQGYSWCISRTDASNMFYSLRMRKNEPMFYFVFDKDRPKDDVWHAVVIYVDNDQVIHVATANNPGDVEMTWEQIVTKQPKLRGLEQLFVPQPLSPDERRDYEKFKDSRDLESYVAMSLRDKIKYIKFGHELTDEQQAATDDIDLLGLYAKSMPTRITKDTFRRIKSGDRRKMISDLLQQDKDMLLLDFASSVETPWHRMGLPEDVVDRVESRIAKRPSLAFDYARHVIRDRFPEGEPVIAKDPWFASEYAREVIRGRWPEAEPVIAKNPPIALDYARHVIRGRWPEAEPEIAKRSNTAVWYALDVIKGRWPEAEPEIAKSNYAATKYAREVIRKPWPAAGIDSI